MKHVTKEQEIKIDGLLHELVCCDEGFRDKLKVLFEEVAEDAFERGKDFGYSLVDFGWH